MADIAHLLKEVRNNFNTMTHRRNAYSISHPMPLERLTSSPSRSPTAFFEQTATAAVDSEVMIDDDNSPGDRAHTGTSTCCCADCVMPGKLTFDEYERHLTTKIETGRREVGVIEDQLVHCYNLMKTLNELEEHAAQLHTRDRLPVNQDPHRWSSQAAAPPSPLDATWSSPDDTPPSPLVLDDSPRASKRQTICGLPSLSTSKLHQPRLQHATAPGSSFHSAVPSSFYSERPSTERDEGSPLRLSQPFSVPARASSSLQARTSRLSKPFSGSWGSSKSLEPFAVGSGDYFDSDVRSPRPGKREDTESHHPMPQTYSNFGKPLPPIHRAYTPRTQSTAELLGTLTSADFLAPANMPYASSHSPASSIFNRRKGFVAVDTSEDYESSGTSTPQHSFKWHAQRMGGMRLMPRRRHSKADELLGFVTPEPGSRPTSAMSLRGTLNEPLEGKKSKLSLLKLSKLSKGRSDN